MTAITSTEMQRMLVDAFAQMNEKAREDGLDFDGAMTRSEIAEALGVSPYFAGQLMHYMVRTGQAKPVKTPRLNLWLERRHLPGIRLTGGEDGTES